MKYSHFRGLLFLGLRPRRQHGFRMDFHRLQDSMHWCGIAVHTSVVTQLLGMVAQRLVSAEHQSRRHQFCPIPAEHKPDECHPSVSKCIGMLCPNAMHLTSWTYSHYSQYSSEVLIDTTHSVERMVLMKNGSSTVKAVMHTMRATVFVWLDQDTGARAH